MKLFVLGICLVVSFSAFSQKTQLELNSEALEAYHRADSILNVVYKKVIVAHKSEAEFIASLKNAQRIWITFRDAEVKVMFPQSQNSETGSMVPMCISLYLEELTKQRIQTLEKFLLERVDDCN